MVSIALTGRMTLDGAQFLPNLLGQMKRPCEHSPSEWDYAAVCYNGALLVILL